MKNTLAITALLALAITSPAAAHGGPVSNRNDWSTLSGESLQQLPPQISAAVRSAQRACGEDRPQTRTGFLRYLTAGDGQKFVSLHFDQFHCARSSALCSSTGCMHRVFVINSSGQAREVWHAQVREINMDDRAGRAEVNVNCADFCASRLLWNGSGFSK